MKIMKNVFPLFSRLTISRKLYECLYKLIVRDGNAEHISFYNFRKLNMDCKGSGLLFFLRNQRFHGNNVRGSIEFTREKKTRPDLLFSMLIYFKIGVLLLDLNYTDIKTRKASEISS